MHLAPSYASRNHFHVLIANGSLHCTPVPRGILDPRGSLDACVDCVELPRGRQVEVEQSQAGLSTA